MRFVKVTLTNGLKAYVNLLQVVRIVETRDATTIYTTEAISFSVVEKPEDILTKLPVIGG